MTSHLSAKGEARGLYQGTPSGLAKGSTNQCAFRHWIPRITFLHGPSIAASVALMALALATTGCGYHTVGHPVALPQDVHTIAVPGFVSQSQTFRIEQIMTDAVVREFNTRTQFHVIHQANTDADAVLRGTVLSASTTPLAYDSQTGRVASALVTVSMQVTLTDRQGKVLFQNPSYLFHEQYELSRDLPTFFEEDSPAVDRLSRDFARTLVANILEAY